MPKLPLQCYLDVAVFQGSPAGESGQLDQVYTGGQTLSHSQGAMCDHKNYEPLNALLFFS